MRVAISILLVLQLFHLPLPCPDLDGECRGVAIHSLADANAWHVLLLGVRPNDDIDRGPIRPPDTDSNGEPTQSPFGDLPMVASVHSHTAGVVCEERTMATHILWVRIEMGRSTANPTLQTQQEFSYFGPPIALRPSVLRI